MCMVCITDVCEPFRYHLCPNSMPGNSRKDSEHKKQHWNHSLCAIRLTSRLPTQFLNSAMKVMVMKIQKTEARCDFEDIPAGTYAIAAIHDENRNGKLDMNWLGVPKEGYGFSNDAKSVVSAPSFSAASFPYDGRDLDLTLSLHY